MNKPTLVQKLFLSHLLTFNQAFFFWNGIIMIILYGFIDLFANIYASFIIGYTSPIFIICAFLFVLFKFITYKNIPIVKMPDKDKENKKENENKQDDKAGDTDDKNSQTNNPSNEKPSIVSFDSRLVNKIFVPIKFLSILYIITNIASAGISIAFQDSIKHTLYSVKPSDINLAEFYVSHPTLSGEAIIDSINSNLAKPLFSSPGKIDSFQIDTTGSYNYHIYGTRQKTQQPFYLSVSNLNSFISNQTTCDVREFCNCNETNECLKDKKIDLFRFLIMSRDTIKDTLYMVRIRN